MSTDTRYYSLLRGTRYFVIEWLLLVGPPLLINFRFCSVPERRLAAALTSLCVLVKNRVRVRVSSRVRVRVKVMVMVRV